MSQENVEALHRAVDAWNSGDLTAWFEFLDENVVWAPLGNIPDLTRTTHGREEAFELLRQWIEPWDNYELETLELEELGEMLIWTARHRASQRSGLALDMPMTALVEFQDARLKRFRPFATKAEALAAAAQDD